ncbi:unnamed protein product, partial [Laminaria digitata]
SSSRSKTSSTRGEELLGGKGSEPTKLDPSLLSSAISSGMPTFLLTKGVPIIDRRMKRFVSARALARTQRKKVPPQSLDYPPDRPLCLRGHTPSMVGPSSVREKPQKSVRGPRGVVNVPTGAFSKPGVLGGLSVSPWVVQEEAERARRAESHAAAISKDPVVFRRKREEGGLLDYAEETHAVKRFLDKIHPLKDKSCPPKSGFSYRKVCHDTEPPDVYDTSLDSVRPRTVGYSPGHVRALSPTPPLTWGGRESSRASLEWREGTGGPLGAVKACLGIAKGASTPDLRSHRIPVKDEKFSQSWTAEAFPASKELPPEQRWPSNQGAAENDGVTIEVRPMWSRQGLRTTLGSSSFSSPVLRPYTSPHDHLGRPMSCGVLSRSTSCLKPQQFDTTQRRSEYTCALVTKREARLAREAEEKLAAKLEEERSRNAAEGREGIEKFEGSLKEVLAQKWKYL